MLIYCLQSFAGARLDREGELPGRPPHEEQTSSSATQEVRAVSEGLLPKSRSESHYRNRNEMSTSGGWWKMTPPLLFTWNKHHIFRLAIAQPPPTAVPAAHGSWRLARADGVPSLLCRGGVRVGLHGWPIPWRNLWGPAHPLVLQPGDRHTPDSRGDLNMIHTMSSLDYCMKFRAQSQILLLEFILHRLYGKTTLFDGSLEFLITLCIFDILFSFCGCNQKYYHTLRYLFLRLQKNTVKWWNVSSATPSPFSLTIT